MHDEPSDALVVFGATGDLAFKKIFPSLYQLVRRGHLDVPIVGVARSGYDQAKLRERAKESVTAKGKVDPPVLEKFLSLIRHTGGDYHELSAFQSLREALGSARRPLYYLAIPPSAFTEVISGLERSGCAKNARVVVEKPFGRDRESARALSRCVRSAFEDDAIFRIDHFLGKESVQNLIYFRFGNGMFEPIWDRRYIERVQITMAETLGVEGRGKFYEEAGAIRDVLQNHLLQVTACLGMEAPTWHDEASVRDQRAEVLRAIGPLTVENVIRGQFRGYREEQGVDPRSNVETFVAARFTIDNWRWAGVPFCIRAGKRMAVTATEVLIEFKVPPPVLPGCAPNKRNHLRFRFEPDGMIALGVSTKTPGEGLCGEAIELVASRSPERDMLPYERLLGDALRGDATAFAKESDVDHGWRIVDPVIKAETPIYFYEPGTNGPKEADRIVGPGGWHDPERLGK
jgi:glucose-6-phosphate 1-dehydrogenase